MKKHLICEAKLVSLITREVVEEAEDAVEMATSRTLEITTATITTTRK